MATNKTLARRMFQGVEVRIVRQNNQGHKGTKGRLVVTAEGKDIYLDHKPNNGAAIQLTWEGSTGAKAAAEDFLAALTQEEVTEALRRAIRAQEYREEELTQMLNQASIRRMAIADVLAKVQG